MDNNLLVFKCHDHFLFFPLFKIKKSLMSIIKANNVQGITTTAILADVQGLHQEHAGINAQMAGYL